MNAQAERFTENYVDAYSAAGFPRIEPGSLYLQDGSAIFTSCTVSNYREALAGLALEPGSVMVQRCFRTRTLDELHESYRPERRALFDMYGGFESADRDDIGRKIDFHGRTMRAVLESSGVKPRQMVFAGSPEDIEAWNLRESDSNIDYRAYPEDGLSGDVPARVGKKVKQYGQGITGHGLEVFVKQGGSWALAGNIVETIAKDGSTTGIDFGGGLEATVQAIHGPEASYLDAELCSRFGMDDTALQNPRLLNLMESLESLMIILAHETDRHPLSSTNSAIDLACRSINVQCAELKLPSESLINLASSYASGDVLDASVFNQAMELINKRREAIGRLVLAAEGGKLSKRLHMRAAQSQRQGHAFTTKKRARIIFDYIHELPPDERTIIPSSLLPEELASVN